MRGLWLAVGMLWAAQPGAITAAPLQTGRESLEKQVDRVFSEWDRPDSPGASLAVVRDGRIVYAKGYGMANLEYGIPNRPATVFHIASLSKQFTAFAIDLLAAEGKLSLDDDVRKYLPELHDFGSAIRMRHLMYHTSGLRDFVELLGMAGWRLDDVTTMEHVLKIVSHQRELNNVTGDEHLYSNTNYALLAVIVERAVKQPFRQFLHERVFGPLGMTNTQVRDTPELVVKNLACSYSPTPGGGWQRSNLSGGTYGSTGVLSTVEDLAKWDGNFEHPAPGTQALMDGLTEEGALNNGKKLSYAHGLSVESYHGLRTIVHGGSEAAYRAWFMRFPAQHFTVIVLSNGRLRVDRLAQQVADLYLADAFKRPAAAPAAPVASSNPIALPARELAAKAGVYADRSNDEIRRVTFGNRKLILAAPAAFPGTLDLSPTANGRFVATSGVRMGLEIGFEQSGVDGRPSLLREGPAVSGRAFERVDPLDERRLAEYAGNYYSDELGTTYTLVLKQGRLIVTHRRLSDFLLEPTFTDRFAGDRWPVLRVRFTRNAANKIDGFQVTGDRARKVSFIRVAE